MNFYIWEATKKRDINIFRKLLGKETLDTNTYGQTKGRNGSYSTNYQQTGRELFTPDEIRLLDNRKSNPVCPRGTSQCWMTNII